MPNSTKQKLNNPAPVSETKSKQASPVSTFEPMQWTMADIRRAIPAHCFERNTSLGMYYLARDMVFAAALWLAAAKAESFLDGIKVYGAAPLMPPFPTSGIFVVLAKSALWLTYWWFQGLVFTGLWTLGHECGHGAFSSSRVVCDTLGFVLHSFLWTPYFSWKIVHHRHHANHASMEHDEVYVPWTRSELGIPAGKPGPEKEGEHEHEHDHEIDLSEYFGDTPLWTLFTLIRQQFLAFPAYLFFNVSGQRNYPKWTNHFNPNSILFKSSQASAVIASDIGMLAMVALTAKACTLYGSWTVLKYYGIPWLLVSHWFIMITYLHHTSPDLPHYRDGAWNFQRGAAATMDRDFLGWQGRFFLHDVAHFHVVHHFFPQMPFYHGEEATKHLKAFIGDHYHVSNEAVFPALWRTYNECQFVDDEGDVLFYRNKKGQLAATAQRSGL